MDAVHLVTLPWWRPADSSPDVPGGAAATAAGAIRDGLIDAGLELAQVGGPDAVVLRAKHPVARIGAARKSHARHPPLPSSRQSGYRALSSPGTAWTRDERAYPLHTVPINGVQAP